MEVVALYQGFRTYHDAQFLGEVFVEMLVDKQGCSTLYEYAEELLYASRFLCLVCVAENGKPKFLHANALSFYVRKVTIMRAKMQKKYKISGLKCSRLSLKVMIVVLCE